MYQTILGILNNTNAPTTTMNGKILIPAVAALAVAMFAAPTLASAVDDFLNITDNKIEVKETIEAKLETGDDIPTDGAFGYGLLTGDTSDAGALITGVIVATTHGGVLDSEDQENAADPIWHNHLVDLTVADPGVCAPNTNLGQFGSPALEVAAITFESPGEVNVDENRIKIEEIPFTFDGTLPPVLGGAPVTISPGGDVTLAVSFTLKPVFNSEEVLTNVCVENLAAVPAVHDD